MDRTTPCQSSCSPPAHNAGVFKVVIVGDSGVGKTTYIKRLLTGEFEKKHVSTLGVEVHPLVFHTISGTVVFNVWDISGNCLHSGVYESYYKCADAAVVMFDRHSESSYQNAFKWLGGIMARCPGIPMVFCGNKVDIKSTEVGLTNSVFQQLGDYYDLSVKSIYNFEKPFLRLARQLTGKPDLCFMEYPSCCPSEVKIDLAQMREYEKNVTVAASCRSLSPRAQQLALRCGEPPSPHTSSTEVRADTAREVAGGAAPRSCRSPCPIASAVQAQQPTAGADHFHDYWDSDTAIKLIKNCMPGCRFKVSFVTPEGKQVTFSAD